MPGDRVHTRRAAHVTPEGPKGRWADEADSPERATARYRLRWPTHHCPIVANMEAARADDEASDRRGDTAGDPFTDALEAAIAGLPEPYRRELASVAIVVEDEPSAEQLTRAGASGLLGLYQGVPRTSYGAGGAPFANKITLFRGPLMRAYPSRDALMRGVRETFDHEVAHHLGISDARLRELKASTSR